MSFGLLSLLPSFVAIALAIATRRVVASLLLAVVVGAALLAWKSVAPPGVEAVAIDPATVSEPVSTPSFAFRWLTSLWHHLYQSVTDPDHVSVLKFSLLLGAMIGILEAGHAMRTLITDLTRRVRERRGGQTMVAGLGLAFFFDDYANTLLLGGTMRRVCDQLKISRAKLAYLVDSTAAPVAGLAVVSTWVATEISLIEEGLPADLKLQAFSLFIESILYRFYPIFALALVFLIARSGRDFGPMRRAEAEAWAAPVQVVETERVSGRLQPWLWLAAILPIVACVVTISWVLISTGKAALLESTDPPPVGLEAWGAVLGNADSYLALIEGGKVGLIVALFAGFAVQPQLAAVKPLLIGALRGAWQIMPAMVVLWFAWALSAMTASDQLDTGGYLGDALSDSLSPYWLPTFVFVVSSLVAFSTGTSWGTMALLTPLAVQLGLRAAGGEASAAVDSPLLVATIGSVLAGAILGDHCSPISDTTVLSSRACDCDHVLHVRTQMPYALVAGGVAIGCGTIPVALGVSPWLCVLLGGIVLAGIVRLCGRSLDEEAAGTPPASRAMGSDT